MVEIDGLEHLVELQELPPPTSTSVNIDMSEWQVTFGMHKGAKFKDVLRDSRYCEFVLNKCKDPYCENMRHLRCYLLKCLTKED